MNGARQQNTAQSIVSRSILLKLTIFVSLLVIITAAALSKTGYEIARLIVQRQIEDRLSVAAIGRRDLLLHFVDRQTERVLLVASRTRLRTPYL